LRLTPVQQWGVLPSGARPATACTRSSARAHSRICSLSPSLTPLTPRPPPSAEVEADDLLGRDPRRRRVHSSMYADLRTNLPREVMGFSDFPDIPAALGGRSADARRFPAHAEVAARRALCIVGGSQIMAGRLHGAAVRLPFH